MKISMYSVSLTALLLLSMWTVAACTIVADDGTEYQIFTPMLTTEDANGGDETPEQPDTELPTELMAEVIVQYDDHALSVRTIDFTTPITGLRALELTGLDITLAETSFGPAVCAIEGVGCPADDCFCGGDFFWGYNTWTGDGWESHPAGAATTVISATDTVEGWRWGEWGAPAVSATQAMAAQNGFGWLQARQVITDGSYNSTVSAGLDVLLALGANHQHGDDWRATSDTPSLLEFTVANGAEYAQAHASQASKLALALTAAQGCLPTDAPLPSDAFDAELGAMASQPGFLALAILGTLGLEADLVDAAALDASVDYLLDQALAGGGWEWFPEWGGDTNTTALVIQALVGAGVDPEAEAIQAAVAALHAAQNDDGGFPYDLDSGAEGISDTNSTAYVVQGLLAAGEDLNDTRWVRQDQTPLDYLLGQQLADGGFMWQAGQEANQVATMQAIPALLGQVYPLYPGTLARCAADGE